MTSLAWNPRCSTINPLPSVPHKHIRALRQTPSPVFSSPLPEHTALRCSPSALESSKRASLKLDVSPAG
jgi:hypothetical protein